MKIEWQGCGFIGLSAKTYFCFDDNAANQKYSSKGLNKSLRLTREHFQNVLDTKTSDTHTNKGFVVKGREMFTYEMRKTGLSYFYCKRKVLDDGVSTTYLDV